MTNTLTTPTTAHHSKRKSSPLSHKADHRLEKIVETEAAPTPRKETTKRKSDAKETANASTTTTHHSRQRKSSPLSQKADRRLEKIDEKEASPPPAPKVKSSIKISKLPKPVVVETPVVLSKQMNRSTSSSSIAASKPQSVALSDASKKLGRQNSLRNLDELNDSKDEADLNALNNHLLRRSTSRSINNTQNNNSTISNSSQAVTSASHLFKPSRSSQQHTISNTNKLLNLPTPPLFNNENVAGASNRYLNKLWYFFAQ